MEPGLICYECVGTHPGCGLTDFDSRWYWGKICPRSDDRCVKVRLRRPSLIVIHSASGILKLWFNRNEPSNVIFS